MQADLDRRACTAWILGVEEVTVPFLVDRAGMVRARLEEEFCRRTSQPLTAWVPPLVGLWGRRPRPDRLVVSLTLRRDARLYSSWLAADDASRPSADGAASGQGR